MHHGLTTTPTPHYQPQQYRMLDGLSKSTSDTQRQAHKYRHSRVTHRGSRARPRRPSTQDYFQAATKRCSGSLASCRTPLSVNKQDSTPKPPLPQRLQTDAAGQAHIQAFSRSTAPGRHSTKEPSQAAATMCGRSAASLQSDVWANTRTDVPASRRQRAAATAQRTPPRQPQTGAGGPPPRRRPARYDRLGGCWGSAVTACPPRAPCTHATVLMALQQDSNRSACGLHGQLYVTRLGAWAVVDS